MNTGIFAAATLFAHYDFSDLATITKDGADRVSQVNDKSGNARHLVQATGGNQPLWVDNGQNGLDIIRFVDRFLEVSWTAISQPLTIFTVLKLPGNAGANRGIYSAGLANIIELDKLATNDKFEWFAGAAVSLTEIGYVDTWRVLTDYWNTSSSAFRISGVQKASGDAGTNTSNGYNIGRPAGQGAGATMDVGEILIYKGTVTDAFRNTKESDLATKWIP